MEGLLLLGVLARPCFFGVLDLGRAAEGGPLVRSERSCGISVRQWRAGYTSLQALGWTGRHSTSLASKKVGRQSSLAWLVNLESFVVSMFVMFRD